MSDYHRSTKLTPQNVRANPTALDSATKPSPYRCFSGLPSVALPPPRDDAATTPALSLLSDGVSAVDADRHHPPQNLQTLADWLFLADGLLFKENPDPLLQRLRTCPSAGGLYPFEVYVAAFAIEGLEPGLYHYGVREWSLCRMRQGAETLGALRRGRPDLNYLKSVPAVMLVSTVFWRSAWRYRQRGYRMALLDAGHLVQNLVTSANALGIATNPRLMVNDRSMRELIGVSSSADFGAAESVQGMVVWADAAGNPMADVGPPPRKGTSLASIKREPLSARHVPYGSITAIHADCSAPGVALRDIRPPLTELSPLPLETMPAAPALAQPLPPGPPMRQVLTARRSVRRFSHRNLSRDQFLALNRLAFRGGSLFPMMPDGPHVAFIRPYWINSLVGQMDAGVWYYDPIGDRLALCNRGNHHARAAFLCVEQSFCDGAAAVCFLVADLQKLMSGAGPDAYRLAHLEAGVAGQRLALAAAALGLGSCGIGAIYDDGVTKFVGLADSTWESLYAIAIGHPENR